MKNNFILFVLIGSILGIIGCASLLPKESAKSKTSWESFKDVKAAYEAIIIGQSDTKHLDELGFGPTTASNVETLGYVEIINRLSPVFLDKNLPDGFDKCLEAKFRCKAYLFNIKNIKRDRIGNVAADLFGFRKETKITGWQLGTTLILVDDKVVYKSWVGIAEIEEYEKKIIPLGPIQNLGDILKPW